MKDKLFYNHSDNQHRGMRIRLVSFFEKTNSEDRIIFTSFTIKNFSNET